MESSAPGPKLKFDSGTWLEGPGVAASLFGEIGFFYVLPTSPTNPNTFWGTVVVANQLAWEFLGGTGGTALSPAMKYFVNNSPTAGPQPLCLYSTIAAAQAAAIADGHGSANPAVLWLLPTATFTENVTMADGISIQGMVSASQSTSAPNITGTVDAGLTATGGVAILSNVAINGRLICAGTKATSVQLDNVTVFQTADNASPVSFSDPSLTVLANRFSVISLGASVFPTIDITTAITFTATEGQIISDSDRVAMSVANAAGSALINFMEVRLQGRILITNKVAMTMRQGRILTTSTMCTFTTDGTLNLLQCEIDIADGTLIATGPGVVRDVDCFFPSGTTGVGITVTTTTVRYTSRLHTEILFEGAGPYTITTLADLYLVDVASGGAGNKVVNLPLLTNVPRGWRFRIQKINSLAANTVTITRNGGETINGQAANIVLAASVLTGAELQAGSATLTDWRASGSTSVP